MTRKNVEVVAIGTGGTDSFHARPGPSTRAWDACPCTSPSTSGSCKPCRPAITPIRTSPHRP
jgi:hypothetical protein